MTNDFITSPSFGIVISIIAYQIGIYINKKTKLSILNPILTASALIIGILSFLKISFSDYNNGGKLISLFLEPATVILAIPLYKNMYLLKKHLKEIIIGIFSGALMSVVSVLILSKIFKLDYSVILSLLPKSITTPIGLEVSKNIGGIKGITVISIAITGITGAVFSSFLISVFKFKNKVAIGIAIGTCSHALGTSRALEIGEVEGAMSSLAIGISGLFTVLIISVLIH